MAPVLLCPECGTKHPLDGVNGAAFPCRGCGRTLKVPEQARVPAASVPPPVTPVADPNATSILPAPVLPPVAAEALVPAPPRTRAARFDPIPGRLIRFALWIVAVPLAFVVVFAIAKLIGVLSTNQVENVALDEGWTRFVPIARLLPFVALATAAFVHGGVYGIARFRSRRHVSPGAGDPSRDGKPRTGRPPRPESPSRPGSSASVA